MAQFRMKDEWTPTSTEKDNDGNGSLSYSSAASSNGESTDSSFGDIMKVLEGTDAREIAQLLQQHQQMQQPLPARRNPADERSLAAESLAYSTDAESMLQRSMFTEGESTALHGADLVSAMGG